MRRSWPATWVTILCLWTSQSAQAWWDDWEVETFTRYRIDNFDNNNNGFVDAPNAAALHMQVERLAIADEVEQRSTDLSIPLLARIADSVVDFLPSEQASNSSSSSQVNSPLVSTATWASSPTQSRVFLDSNNASVDGPQQSLSKTFSQYRGLSLEHVVRFGHSSNQLTNSDLLSTVQFFYGVGYNNDYQFLKWALSRYSFYLWDVETVKAGPYVGLIASARRRNWQFVAGGRVQYAWDRYHESSRMHIVPEVFGSEIESTSHRADYSEALLGEFQLQVRRSFSPNLGMRIGYSGYFLGPIGDVRRGLDFVPNQIVSPHATTNVIAGAAFAVLELRR